MCADKEIKMIVKANTMKKAISMAKNTLYKDGYFHVNVRSCEEIKKGENG
jgi:hypothetical protein